VKLYVNISSTIQSDGRFLYTTAELFILDYFRTVSVSRNSAFMVLCCNFHKLYRTALGALDLLVVVFAWPITHFAVIFGEYLFSAQTLFTANLLGLSGVTIGRVLLQCSCNVTQCKPVAYNVTDSDCMLRRQHAHRPYISHSIYSGLRRISEWNADYRTNNWNLLNNASRLNGVSTAERSAGFYGLSDKIHTL